MRSDIEKSEALIWLKSITESIPMNADDLQHYAVIFDLCKPCNREKKVRK